jgi:hypothetical protein
MDSRAQRAILLKALMEALNKTRSVQQADFRNEDDKRVGGHFSRFNATEASLSQGLDPYLKMVKARFDGDPTALPSDPIWALVRDYVYGEAGDGHGAAPVPPALFGIEGWNQAQRRGLYLREMGGCWFIFRLSTDATLDDPEVAVALLSIRTQGWYTGDNNPWTEFILIVHQEGDGNPRGRIEGVCMQYHTHLHFVGLLDRETSPIPTAMALRYEPGGSKNYMRREATDGLIFGANSHGRQISAPIDAIFVKGSDSWANDDYRLRRAEYEKRISTHHYKDIADILPKDRFEALVQRTRDSLVFQAR